MKWVIPLLVILLYVQLFNTITPLYFESNYTLTLFDLGHLVKKNLGFDRM